MSLVSSDEATTAIFRSLTYLCNVLQLHLPGYLHHANINFDLSQITRDIPINGLAGSRLLANGVYVNSVHTPALTCSHNLNLTIYDVFHQH